MGSYVRGIVLCSVVKGGRVPSSRMAEEEALYTCDRSVCSLDG
jgi:hypothetical protein